MDTIELTKLTLTGIGIILTFITLVFGISKFSEEKNREFQKTFFSAQLEIYKQAAHHSSSLYVYPKSSNEYKTHYSNYKSLFFGEMCIVEDKVVEERMVQFNIILNLYDEAEDSLQSSILKNELKHFSLVLAHTLRNSSIETWKIKEDVLGKLFNDYSKTPDEDKIRIEVCHKMVSGELKPELFTTELNKRLSALQPK
ncbi:hypothetical protein [Aquimarina sp. 2201CG14-23]|uniref:hypothetical protein n=1 Tax=Aquimarina mycalae TaxID=3040073 RepID=UPI0024782530|nr:hypothetical protein [Aquimarina sp. 2201CG14-23]MDH7445654.1 hypothetical protein [Aquimarina sp. 2201CG14-23]